MTTISKHWIEYFFSIAKVISMKSKDTTKVGCILINLRTNGILSTGYNGSVRGLPDDPKLYPEQYTRPTKYLYVCHAEANALMHAARCGVATESAAAFITLPPCIECVKLMIQAGIAEVHFLSSSNFEKEAESSEWKKNVQLGLNMLDSVKLPYYRYNESDVKLMFEQSLYL